MTNKIICSLEEWDSILDYYRPNGTSKSWGINEVGKLMIPPTWDMWHFGDDKKIPNRLKMENMVTPNFFYDNFIYTPYDEIKDSKHFYFIFIWSDVFFINPLGFKGISEKYKNDVRNGKSKIFLFFMCEGASGSYGNNELETIEKWRIEENFPDYSIYYFSGNLLIDKIAKAKELKLNCFGTSCFEFTNHNFLINGDPIKFKPIDDKYLFLSYNRMIRANKVYFVYKILKKKLNKKGLISLGKIDEYESHYDINQRIIKYLSKITPLRIDDESDLNVNLCFNVKYEDYEKTFMSIVTETLVDNDTLFITEKTWKPIIVGHPFIVYGNVGTLKYLKDLGYRTFDRWIDESYDEENDHFKRCHMIIDEIEKFKNYSIEDLTKIREEMFETCNHNKKHYYKRLKENYKYEKNKQLNDYLISEWNKFLNE